MIYRGKDHTCGPAKRKQPIARGGILIVKQKLGTSASLVGVAQPRRKENYISPIAVAYASSTSSKTQSALAVFLLQHKNPDASASSVKYNYLGKSRRNLSGHTHKNQKKSGNDTNNKNVKKWTNKKHETVSVKLENMTKSARTMAKSRRNPHDNISYDTDDL